MTLLAQGQPCASTGSQGSPCASTENTEQCELGIPSCSALGLPWVSQRAFVLSIPLIWEYVKNDATHGRFCLCSYYFVSVAWPWMVEMCFNARVVSDARFALETEAIYNDIAFDHIPSSPSSGYRTD